MITLDQLCWIAIAAYAIHVLEEHTLDWRAWALFALGLPFDWPTFYVSKSMVLVLGIVSAQVAPQTPILALCFPAFLLVEATLSHVLPVLLMRGQFSPGLLTAVLLFYPIGGYCYWTVFQMGLLTRSSVIASLVGGAALVTLPLFLLNLRTKEYFFPLRKR